MNWWNLHKKYLYIKQKNGVGNGFERLEDYLPRDIIYRPKTGFGAPLRRWMRVELKDLFGICFRLKV